MLSCEGSPGTHSTVPATLLIEPRIVVIERCRAWNVACVWTGSMVQVLFCAEAGIASIAPTARSIGKTFFIRAFSRWPSSDVLEDPRTHDRLEACWRLTASS